MNSPTATPNLLKQVLHRGKSSLALFKPAQPGTYTFYCGIPGHYDKATGEGMHGTLIVE